MYLRIRILLISHTKQIQKLGQVLKYQIFYVLLVELKNCHCLFVKSFMRVSICNIFNTEYY